MARPPRFGDTTMHKNRIADLVKILPPPKEPLDWDESVLARNERALGIEFPKDFVEFGRLYGSGHIDSAYSWEVWSPCRRVYPFMVMQFARKWNLFKDAMEVTDM